jgi:CBS domain-containing protein
MKTATAPRGGHRPFDSLRAEDLMSPNPLSIRAGATIPEALDLLADRGYGAAPVIDEAGRPVGVLSRTDVLIHEREYVRHAYARGGTEWDLLWDPSPGGGLPVEVVDPTTVAEIMTPAVFTVPPETPAREVVKRMLELKVHHLFVVDSGHALVGVISPLDVLRHLEE